MASDRVRLIMPALPALYAGSPSAVRPLTEPMLTIAPARRAFMFGSTACTQLYAPVRFTSTSALKASGDVRSIVGFVLAPALFTSTPIGPRASAHLAKVAAMAAA